MTRIKRDQPAALASSEALQAQVERENERRAEVVPDMLAALIYLRDCIETGK